MAYAHSEAELPELIDDLVEDLAEDIASLDVFELCYKLDDLNLYESEAEYSKDDAEQILTDSLRVQYARSRIKYLEEQNDSLRSFHCVKLTDQNGRQASLFVRGESLGQGGLSFFFESCVPRTDDGWRNLLDKGYFRLGVDIPTDQQILHAWQHE